MLIDHQCNATMHRKALGRKKAGEKPFAPCASTFHMLLPHIGDEKRVWQTLSCIKQLFLLLSESCWSLYAHFYPAQCIGHQRCEANYLL